MIVKLGSNVLNVVMEYVPSEDGDFYDPPVKEELSIVCIMDTHGNDVTDRYYEQVIDIILSSREW